MTGSEVRDAELEHTNQPSNIRDSNFSYQIIDCHNSDHEYTANRKC